MEPNAFPQLQLWCPRPFGTYSQNKPCPAPASTKKPFSCRPTEEPTGAQAPSENTPPAPTDAAPAPPASAEEGRVLLDTWYVIKPGNTKEKVAFFVAHQCGGGTGGIGAPGSRANTMKVKGNWGSDSSKAKRRRRCHDPAKAKATPAWATGNRDPAYPLSGELAATAGEGPDLLSVAEMVALVEQRTALALQSFPRPCGAPAAPIVFVEAAGGETKAPSGSDCNRVAEAVAHFESRQREHGTARPNGMCRPGAECAATTAAASSVPGPGEVRIAFRISSSRETRAGAAAAEPGSVGRPNCVFMNCGPANGGGGTGGGRAKDKITCDLYQLISPSRDALPNNVEFLLAAAGSKGDTDGSDMDTGCGEGSASAVKAEMMGEGNSEGSSGRDCASGFHVDVVVTGVVDQCVFFGKDSAKKMKEETVRLPAAQEEPPPPGQLFLLPIPEEPAAAAAAEDAESGEEASAVSDPSLCRLYRHVSHDFLEIRFKIQRLLEPRQYMLLLPEHVMVKIFSYLPTHALAALKCSCHYFKSIIETFGVQATDSRWNRDPLYRDDPCKQCKKHYEKGDVSLCRWHPKPYHHDLPYGRSYWMCCRRADKEAPGCRVGLHDNNWVHPATRRDDGR
ncbi:F-box only protein 46 [Cuculus canorus]|uniref:F-box only protein 46 n=1 Tax=Cuculus canorus TaxID=55661 RepID=UPI0023AA5601|nr:F-box only protein 46 [Cuculus canorus]XP_053908851.1 F-box only protein 46 [Cuculus canorus]